MPSQPQPLARQKDSRHPAFLLAEQFTANQLLANSGLIDTCQTNAPAGPGGRGRALRPRILSNYNNPPHYFFRTMFCLSCVVVWLALGSAFAFPCLLFYALRILFRFFFLCVLYYCIRSNWFLFSYFFLRAL